MCQGSVNLLCAHAPVAWKASTRSANREYERRETCSRRARTGYGFMPASAALRCHSNKATPSSRAGSDGVLARHASKYLPLTPATSDDDAK
jgi:hypothetical protein